MNEKLARKIMLQHGMRYARINSIGGITWKGQHICYCIYNHTLEAFTEIIKEVTA